MGHRQFIVNSWKLIARTISLAIFALVAQRPSTN